MSSRFFFYGVSIAEDVPPEWSPVRARHPSFSGLEEPPCHVPSGLCVLGRCSVLQMVVVPEYKPKGVMCAVSCNNQGIGRFTATYVLVELSQRKGTPDQAPSLSLRCSQHPNGESVVPNCSVQVIKT